MILKVIYLIIDYVILLLILVKHMLHPVRYYFICGEYGRIGNKLFFFSHVIAWARENNARVFYPSFHPYASWFTGSQNDFLVSHPPKKRRFVGNHALLNRIASNFLHRISLRLGHRPNAFLIRSIVLEDGGLDICTEDFDHLLARRGILFIRGFIYTSNKDYLIERHHPILRKYFSPLKRYEEGIQEPFEKLRRKCDLVVGVVIRHGDYRDYRGGEYFYSLSVFQRVLKELTAHVKSTKLGFFIASDEDQDTSAFEQFPYFFRQGHPMENLNALSRCDYLIGSPSTFLTWPAFFGKVPCFQLFPEDLEKDPIPFVFNVRDTCS